MITFRVSPDLFEQIEEKRRRSNEPLPDIAVRLFEDWLAAEEGRERRRPRARISNDPLLEKLAAIRASGDKELVNIVTYSIEACCGVLKHSLKPEEIEYLRTAKRFRGGGWPGTFDANDEFEERVLEIVEDSAASTLTGRRAPVVDIAEAPRHSLKRTLKPVKSETAGSRKKDKRRTK